MKVEIADQLPVELDDVVHRFPRATFYHSRVWLECVASAYPEMRLQAIIARTAAGIVGYLPYFVLRTGPALRCWSSPFGTYGGPAAFDDETAARLVDVFAGMQAERGVHEIGIVDYSGSLSRRGFVTKDEATHIVDLTPGFEALWTRHFDKSKRRQTRKAEREGIVVRRTASPADVDRYYDIYMQRSRIWRQHVYYRKSLFSRLVELGGDSVKLFIACRGDELLGGHLNFYFRDDAIAWNGMTADSSRAAQASTLLYSTCIRDACGSGYKMFNLGSSLGKESLALYKEALGARRYRYCTMRWRSRQARVASAVLKLFPRRLLHV